MRLESGADRAGPYLKVTYIDDEMYTRENSFESSDEQFLAIQVPQRAVQMPLADFLVEPRDFKTDVEDGSMSKCDCVPRYDSKSYVNHGVSDSDRRETTPLTDSDRQRVTTAATTSTSKQCTVADIAMNGGQSRAESAEIDGEAKTGS